MGKPPFECATVQDTLRRVSRKDYKLHHFLSDEAQDLLQKLLQESPDHRMTPEEILEHPLFKKKQEEPLYILKGLMSPDGSPEPEERKQPRCISAQQQFRSAEKASSGFNRIESKLRTNELRPDPSQ